MSTPYLGIPHVATNTSQPEVVINSAFDALDGAIAGQLTVPYSGADVTLTATQAAMQSANALFGSAASAARMPPVKAVAARKAVRRRLPQLAVRAMTWYAVMRRLPHLSHPPRPSLSRSARIGLSAA